MIPFLIQYLLQLNGTKQNPTNEISYYIKFQGSVLIYKVSILYIPPSYRFHPLLCLRYQISLLAIFLLGDILMPNYFQHHHHVLKDKYFQDCTTAKEKKNNQLSTKVKKNLEYFLKRKKYFLYFRVRRVHDCVNNSRFQIQENSPWNIVFIIRLIKKHIFTVSAFSRKIFQNSLRADTMLSAESLPKLKAN